MILWKLKIIYHLSEVNKPIIVKVRISKNNWCKRLTQGFVLEDHGRFVTQLTHLHVSIGDA